ncbi:hypothetical protein IWW50_000391 [Coemansia erecta]|nr:hypothetical protein IWW50_000391 [Coemansia erecta]
MVAIRYFGFALLAAAAAYAAAEDDQAKAEQSPELSTRGLHSNPGHIIFQSMTPTLSDPAIADPTDTTELSDLGADQASMSSDILSPSSSGLALPENAAECMRAGVEDWDRDLQIGGVFIILVLSFAGAMLPIACKHVSWLRANARIFAVGKFFGAGVILATAFVHMLGAAIETLGDSCLEARLGGFDSWPALLAMLAVLAMHLMEHVLSRRIRQHSGCSSGEGKAVIDSSAESVQTGENGQSTPRVNKSMHEDLSQLEKNDTIQQPQHAHVHATVFASPDSDEQRKRLSTYILELGIALHSIIVGMTLAVSGGSEFKTLLAAISFHQFFEGMALGTRISALNFRRTPLLLCVFNASIFALTTPVGQVIGIGIRQSFAPRSPSSLLTMGVLDALSAGILLYSAIVNLLVEEFAAFEFRQSKRSVRIMCFAAMYAGCAAMTIIGKWA